MFNIRNLPKSVAAFSARLLFPPYCPGCGRIVSEPGMVCVACWSGLRFIEKPWCPVMGTPFVYDMGPDFVSDEAAAEPPPPFQRARAVVSYSGVACSMVLALKYGDRTDLAAWMARWMMRTGCELVADAELVVPMPLHWRRFLARRYNQSAELGRAVAALGGLPFEPGALHRIRATRRQVGLCRSDRTINVSGAFEVKERARRLIAGKRVLLVDDVYTTGATAAAASEALTEGGAAAVDVLTFARVLPGDFQQGEAGTI